MDRTRSQRTTAKARDPLDVVDLLGKSSWHAGFVLQAVWHLMMIALCFTEPYASTPPDSHGLAVALGRFHQMNASILPYSDRLMRWAISLSMCSFPWNPRFKQSIRGFTAHILGFRQWYSYQLLALLVRLVAFSITQYSRSHGLSSSAQLSAQFVIPLLMIQVSHRGIVHNSMSLNRCRSTEPQESRFTRTLRPSFGNGQSWFLIRTWHPMNGPRQRNPMTLIVFSTKFRIPPLLTKIKLRQPRPSSHPQLV